ncbi:hypothetical protein C8Q78DRAFT_602432 [Trametes maxima]|nr:hypothetical protein C8Q78DRAFT_602432 [Trametes maxima]
MRVHCAWWRTRQDVSTAEGPLESRQCTGRIRRRSGDREQWPWPLISKRVSTYRGSEGAAGRGWRGCRRGLRCARKRTRPRGAWIKLRPGHVRPTRCGDGRGVAERGRTSDDDEGRVWPGTRGSRAICRQGWNSVGTRRDARCLPSRRLLVVARTGQRGRGVVSWQRDSVVARSDHRDSDVRARERCAPPVARHRPTRLSVRVQFAARLAPRHPQSLVPAFPATQRAKSARGHASARSPFAGRMRRETDKIQRPAALAGSGGRPESDERPKRRGRPAEGTRSRASAGHRRGDRGEDITASTGVQRFARGWRWRRRPT